MELVTTQTNKKQTKQAPSEQTKLIPTIPKTAYSDQTRNLKLTIKEREQLEACLLKLIDEKKGELTNAGCLDILFSCGDAMEQEQNRQLSKDDYRDILEALHKQIGPKLHEALDAAGFNKVHKYSYHSNSKAEQKIEALSSWLESVRANPIARLCSYMSVLGLSEITDFFSAVTNPMEIGAASAELAKYQSTGIGKSPEYMLSDADGAIGAIILAAVRAGHLSLPNEAYETFARVLVRERFGNLRVLICAQHKGDADENDLAKALEKVDQDQYQALKAISTNPYFLTFRGDTSACKSQFHLAYKLQADQAHSDDLLALVNLVIPTHSKNAPPLRLIGDILNDRHTCNDDAMNLLMGKLPNVVKYRGNHDEPFGKALGIGYQDSGGFRAQPNFAALEKLVETFTFFTWEENTFISHFGLSCAVSKTASADSSLFNLTFTLGSGRITIAYLPNEVRIDENGRIFFIGNEAEVTATRTRTLQAFIDGLFPGYAKAANGTVVKNEDDGTTTRPEYDGLHNCNTLLGIRQICGHHAGFGLEGEDVLRINSRALKDDSVDPGLRVAPGLVFVANGDWPAKEQVQNERTLLQVQGNHTEEI